MARDGTGTSAYEVTLRPGSWVAGAGSGRLAPRWSGRERGALAGAAGPGSPRPLRTPTPAHLPSCCGRMSHWRCPRRDSAAGFAGSAGQAARYKQRMG